MHFFRENGHKNREKNGIRLRMSFFFRTFAAELVCVRTRIVRSNLFFNTYDKDYWSTDIRW